jgi:hypothetical protein
MHGLILVLVFADNAESALVKAHEVVHEKLKTTCNGGPFDYYVDFTERPRRDPSMIGEEMVAAALDDKGISTPAHFGKDRWGPMPPVLQVSTARFPTDDKSGLEVVNLAMEFNRKEFKDDMTYIRYLTANYTDDQLFDEVEGKGEIIFEGKKVFDDPSRFRYRCEDACGGFPGPSAHLYDFTGGTISCPKHLQLMLNDSDSDPYYMDETDGQDPNWGQWNPIAWQAAYPAILSNCLDCHKSSAASI